MEDSYFFDKKKWKGKPATLTVERFQLILDKLRAEIEFDYQPNPFIYLSKAEMEILYDKKPRSKKVSSKKTKKKRVRSSR